MLYFISIPTDEHFLIKHLINKQHDYCYHYRTYLKVAVGAHAYVLIGFAHGKIDDRAVFVHLYDTERHQMFEMPLMRDEHLLGHLKKTAQLYNLSEQVWLLFLCIYLHTHKRIDPQKSWTFRHLAAISRRFPSQCLMWLYSAIIYLAMVSEENYSRKTEHGVQPTYLGKEVKFVGAFQTLRLDWLPQDAAYFSRRRPFNQIEKYFQRYWVSDQRDPKVRKITNEYFYHLMQ